MWILSAIICFGSTIGMFVYYTIKIVMLERKK